MTVGRGWSGLGGGGRNCCTVSEGRRPSASRSRGREPSAAPKQVKRNETHLPTAGGIIMFLLYNIPIYPDFRPSGWLLLTTGSNERCNMPEYLFSFFRGGWGWWGWWWKNLWTVGGDKFGLEFRNNSK